VTRGSQETNPVFSLEKNSGSTSANSMLVVTLQNITTANDGNWWYIHTVHTCCLGNAFLSQVTEGE
jgi:hypothetical protein